MLCSHARSQPACFSGRTLPTAPSKGRCHQSLHPSLRSLFTILAAAQQSSASEKADAEALRRSVAGLRAKIANFDSKPYSDHHSKQSIGTELQSAVFPPLKREFLTREDVLMEASSPHRSDAEILEDLETFERDTRHSAEQAKHGELFDWAHQILVAEAVNGHQLLQLMTELSRAVASAERSERAELHRHKAFLAAEQALSNGIDEIGKECLVRLAIEFGTMAALGGSSHALQVICRQLVDRHTRDLQVSNVLNFEFLAMVASLPSIPERIGKAAKQVLKQVDVKSAGSRDLHSILRCISAVGASKKLKPQLYQAVIQSVEKLDQLEAAHLADLITMAGSTRVVLPRQAVQKVADRLIAADPSLDSIPNIVALLEGCAEAGLQHLELLQAAAEALAARMQIEEDNRVLLSLHILGELHAQMSEVTRENLAKALREKFSDSHIEIASRKSGDFALLIRSMRRLKITPPRRWLDSATCDIIERILNLLKAGQASKTLRKHAVAELSYGVLCLGYMESQLGPTNPIFPAVISILPEAGESNLAIIARGMCRLASVNKVPQAFWEVLDSAAAESLGCMSDLHLCQIMHSFARWRVLPAKLITLIGDEIMDRSSRLDLHKSSVLLWSLAMLSYSEECTNAVMQAVVKRIDYLLQVRDYKEGQSHTVDMSNMAWALATLDLGHSSLAKLIHRIMSHARPIQTMSGISVAIMLWACSICEAKPFKVSQYIARVEDVVQDLEPLQITTILWSVAKLDHHPGIELMEALLSAINLNIAGFAPQGVGQALWACGRLRHHPGVLVKTVLMDLQRRGGEYALEDWTVIIWALTSVGENTADFLQLAHHMIEEFRLDTDLKLLSTLIWSAAVFELFRQPVYNRLMQSLSSFRLYSRDGDSIRRVQEAHLLGCLVGYSRPNDLHPSFRLRGGVQQWMAELMSQDLGPQTRHQYNRIKTALARLSIPAISNYQVVPNVDSFHGRGLRESVVLRQPYGTRRMIAVEILSPNMLTVNTHQPMWRVIYRAAGLCALGMDIIWVPYSEWEAALSRNVEEEYLLSRINAVLSGSVNRPAIAPKPVTTLNKKALV